MPHFFLQILWLVYEFRLICEEKKQKIIFKNKPHPHVLSYFVYKYSKHCLMPFTLERVYAIFIVASWFCMRWPRHPNLINIHVFFFFWFVCICCGRVNRMWSHGRDVRLTVTKSLKVAWLLAMLICPWFYLIIKIIRVFV